MVHQDQTEKLEMGYQECVRQKEHDHNVYRGVPPDSGADLLAWGEQAGDEERERYSYKVQVGCDTRAKIINYLPCNDAWASAPLSKVTLLEKIESATLRWSVSDILATRHRGQGLA